MSDAPETIATKLEQLLELALFELRQEWRHLYRMQPPARLSRDLLTRGIAYRLQEQARGGVPKAVSRRLEKGRAQKAVGASRSGSAPLTIKPGTRLIREWRGVTHSVLVQADHVEWNGERYRSLSEVARAITGTRWSGPRFFGLSKRTEKAAGRGDGLGRGCAGSVPDRAARSAADPPAASIDAQSRRALSGVGDRADAAI